MFAALFATTIVIIAKNGYHSKETTKEEKTEKIETKQPEKLVITIPERATKGNITIYSYDGTQYGWYGDIDIVNNGANGKDIEIELQGWLVDYYPHGTPEYTE